LILSTDGTNRRFEFHKRRQFFFSSHNEPLPTAAMRVNDPDCSSVRIHNGDPAQTPTGFAELVSDDRPVFHADVGGD
jgi:hypothetical protein